MGEVGRPEPVQLFCGVIFSRAAPVDDVKAGLEKEFGTIDFTSGVFDFNETDYYEKEMGPGLRKIFFSFETLISPGTIADIKLVTNRIEHEYPRNEDGSGRLVNLDPGYLSLAKMTLATTKDNFHRIYLGKGIFAEVTLKFEKKKFRPLPWTYPDYRTEEYIEYFNELRSLYREKLKYKDFHP